MKFVDAVSLSVAAAIRRSSWVPGLRLFWDDGWRYANEFEAILGQSRLLPAGRQGMITPESVVADDWEVIER